MALITTLPPLYAEDLDAILAGLRALQSLMTHDQLPPKIHEILTDHGRGLDLDDIDDLCERLNCA